MRMAAWPVSTSIGEITLFADESAVTGLSFGALTEELPRETPLLREAERQLQAYLAGTLQVFTLPLRPKGTEFQQKVWRALQTIPYGQTICYSQLAERVGNPRACRAVGLANNRNPLPIFIPCHRVIGKNGSLVGYGGGLPVKEHLLALEQIVKPPQNRYE